MVFPYDIMVVNIGPKELSYIGILKGFIPKGKRNVGVKFLLYGFKNDVVSFLYMN